MFIQKITSRFLSTVLLLFFASSVSLTALPCFCSGTCHSEEGKQQDSVTGVEGCHTVSDQQSKQDCKSSSDGLDTSQSSSLCGCDAPADQLLRYQTQPPEWYFQLAQLDVGAVPEFNRFERYSNEFVYWIRKPPGLRSIPAYIHHSSFLL